MATHTRLASVAISTILLATATMSNPSPTTAGPESDIPGIPLPASVATGYLGGPIYDVVYRLLVQPGYVIVAGLTGPAGTDFDLYLFDSTATTVVSNQGLLAKSTGPTSVENLSYPSFAGGTYYIDLNGASDIEGTYTLTVQLVADQTAPVASLLLADGNPLINSTTVTVRLTAFAPLSGISEMSFSPDGVTFGAWETYTLQSTWTFPEGDGPKRLWAKVRSGVGVESAPAQDAVILDSVPPTPISINPVPGESVASLRPAFTIKFSEAIEATSWTQLGLIVQAANGQRVDGAFTYDEASDTGTFVPSADLLPGTPYVVTIGQVRDLAGNVTAPLTSWTVTPKQPTSISISVSPQIVPTGSAVVISGVTIGLDGEVIALAIRPSASTVATDNGPFVPQAGRISVSQVPAVNTSYRWRYLGSPTSAATESHELRVLVRRGVSLVGVSPTSTRTVAALTKVTLVAQVTPAGPGAKLSFQLFRYDSARRAYVYGGSFGRTADSAGTASVNWTPPPGRFYWRVAVLPSPEFANNITPLYRWTVTSR
jgi:hypothetical protein